MLARPIATWGYVAAYLVVLMSFIVIWFRHSDFLYIGRDADLSLWLDKAYLDWARPLDVTAMNPLQGMTSMLMAINPYFNPAVWIFQTDFAEISKQVISLVIYFIEVTLSTFALGVALGFSRPFAFAASLWLAILLFPPFNFVFGLQGWLATNPLYGHTLTLSNLLLVAFINIGADADEWTKRSFVRRLALNWLLASCVFILILLSVLAAPFYNGGMLLGSLLLAGVIFLSSTSYAQLLWRLTAGIYVLACCAALHFPEFFAGARNYSARFSGSEHFLPAFHWSTEFAPDLITRARDELCAWGLLCDRLTQWPFVLTGSRWLQLAIIVGGIAVAIRMRSPLARIGALFSVLWIILLLVWIGASLEIITALPLSPLYVYLMMYPFWALFSLYAVVTLLEISAAAFGAKWPNHVWVPLPICLAALALVALFRAGPGDLLKQHDPHPRVGSPITEILEREISLRPGQTYRGSVATLLGSPGSPLRQRLLENAERPLKSGEFEKFLQNVALATGTTHDLLDLWWRDIPTLSEYGQGISKPLMFYVSNVFNAQQDAQDLNFALPRLANIDLLRAMGVRFAVTDVRLPASQASVTRRVPLKDGVDLYLYELPHPNIGGFSPLKLSEPVSPTELLQRIRANPALFESEAFADSSATEQLVPVQRSQMIFERGAVHVTASSTGTSALLLPLQFSHCFRLAAEQADRVKVLRANLIHTLILFAGGLDVRLKWEFSFWRNSGCRLRDAEDVRALGLR